MSLSTSSVGAIIYRSSSAQVTISAPGDSKPQFLQKVYQGTVEEEQDPGVVILRVNFQTTGEIPVTLQVQSEADKFSISSNGELTTKVKLDFDDSPHNYSVEISISDGITSDSAIIEVHVTDINDNSPVFASTTVTKSVPEGTEVGSNVTIVPATDKDSNFNKEIRYSLRGGEGMFSIDPISGMVSVAGALDRETTANYSLLVVAEDQGRPARSATATLMVQVSDINDNVPKFFESEYEVEVLETKEVETRLLTLSAVDPDEGANGRLTYSIFQQSPTSDPAVFELDASTGTLWLAKPLDYSEVKMYTLMVQASDGGVPSLVGNGSVLVKVKDVNNNPPEFSKDSYNVAVSENLATGASILTLEVTDRDEGGFSKGHFLYTNDTFDINEQGVVSLRKDIILDRETIDSYLFQVVAVDQPTDGLRGTAQLNITILDYNDNAPQFPSIPDPLQIFEGEYSVEVPGEVFTIEPTDADIGPNGEVNLYLASPNPLFRFREDGTLLAIGSLDRESRETYELVVKASDKGSPKRENITTIRVSLIDVNDNPPEFSSSSYVSSILLKDVEEGKLVLTLSATDKDAGNNSRISYSFSTGNSPYLALNSETGAVTLTSDSADLTEDTTLVLTAMATDHGHPPLNSTGQLNLFISHVVVNLRIVSFVEAVAFERSSYNFSVPENQPEGETIGEVWASSGSDLYEVAYKLKTYTDLFSVNSDGAVLTTTQLDKEQQEWYILDVEAMDTRTPPTSAITTIRVHVEDVNESPQFPNKVYKASVYSIAPYKTPVIQVKASDPDVGDQNQLVYSLSADSPSFDVEPVSGMVFVVSAMGEAGQTTVLEVKATDSQGLYAEATVEVMVQGSASSSDVVIISLNQPANTVEKKLPELEKSLSKVLDWTVNVLQVSSSSEGSTNSRGLRESVRTSVSFVAVDGDEVVSSEEVTKKLQSQSAAVNAQLALVFGEGFHFDVETRPQSSTSNQAAVIALGVLLALSILGLIVTVTLIIRFKKKTHQDSDKETFDIDQHSQGYTNRNWSQTSEQAQMSPQESRTEGKQQRMDKETAQCNRWADEEETIKTDRLQQDKESDTDDSHTSAL
ncbi:cadherin EGF LAG seven-pass G-type receptor 2 [Leuresthes tenuis]|uniref:cadherin EGF LAG seven-pass G-type receptor 2 n=1 Tax=Leuresthes tenuis TaxID=355514 RepID=UPI003B509E33